MKAETVTTFSALRPGDQFRVVGLRGTDADFAFCKMTADRAAAMQSGEWQQMPADWPVYVIQTTQETARRDFKIDVEGILGMTVDEFVAIVPIEKR